MDKEMMAALEANGEKLRQLTGENHGPVFIGLETLEHCDYCDRTLDFTTCREPDCPMSFPL